MSDATWLGRVFHLLANLKFVCPWSESLAVRNAVSQQQVIDDHFV